MTFFVIAFFLDKKKNIHHQKERYHIKSNEFMKFIISIHWIIVYNHSSLVRVSGFPSNTSSPFLFPSEFDKYSTSYLNNDNNEYFQ